MNESESVPNIRIGVRTARPYGFNALRTYILRSTANTVDATVEVVGYPEPCDIALTEQGVVYDTAPSAYSIHLSHQEARDPFQVSMRVRREIKEYLASNK